MNDSEETKESEPGEWIKYARGNEPWPVPVHALEEARARMIKLEKENAELKALHENNWNVEPSKCGKRLRVCFGEHDAYEACKWVEYEKVEE